MTKEQTRELLNDYINFHIQKGNVSKETLDAFIASAKEYIEGIIE